MHALRLAVQDRMRERFAPVRIEPVRVRVWFEAPIAWDVTYPMRIEGALQYAALGRCCRVSPHDLFADYRGPLFELPIPVADERIEGLPIACASIAHPAPGARFGSRLRARRTRAETINKPTVMTNGGEYKALAIRVPTLHTPWLDFYVRADVERLADLCRDLQFLGRDGARGMGIVERVEFASDPDDRSLVFERRPQRAIPVANEHDAALRFDPSSYVLGETNTRAPYWNRASRALCAVPA